MSCRPAAPLLGACCDATASATVVKMGGLMYSSSKIGCGVVEFFWWWEGTLATRLV
jgi:hypothetical protein